MKQKRDKKGSLYFHLLRLLIFAAFVAMLVFLALNYAGDRIVSSYYDSSGYEKKKDQAIVEQMQRYITKNGLSSKDAEALNTWVKGQKIISVQVYKAGRQVFDSSYPNQELWEEEVIREDYEWEVFYPLEFTDGTAKVSVTGMYAYQFYSYATIAELVLSFGLFLVIVLLGIKSRMNYILLLSDEIEILEGGSLDYEITVSGNDEITALAAGLDSMRLSFRKLIEQEAAITEENQRIITEMSHDIRTPVTSIMLYAEILRKGNFKGETQFQEYIDKIDVKARRIKQFTDQLFNYSLTGGEGEIAMEEPEYFDVLFYDLLSETCSYLEHRGFQVQTDIQWPEKKTRITTDYVTRIMDNITSNITKYADVSDPVVICTWQESGMGGFFFDNQVRRLKENGESAGIGLRSVRNMMVKMGGRCIVKNEKDRFRVTILFPLCNE